MKNKIKKVVLTYFLISVFIPQIIYANQENLKSFAKLYGYVRFFHPSDEAASIDWNYFAIYGSKKVTEVKGRNNLKIILQQLFLPMAPTIKIFESEKKIQFDGREITPPDLTGYKPISWQHHGVSLSRYSRSYKSIRLYRPDTLSVPYGNGKISRTIDPKKYKLLGKRIKLIANVKAKVRRYYGEGRLSVKIERKGGITGFKENMLKNPIVLNQWKQYQIAGNVAEDAEKINISAYLRNGGELWIDDFKLLVKKGKTWKEVEIENTSFNADKIGNKPSNWRCSGENHIISVISMDSKSDNKSLYIKSKPMKQIDKLFNQHSRIGDLIQREIGNGLSCIVPVVLYGNKFNTYPKVDSTRLKKFKEEISKSMLQKVTCNSLFARLGNIVNAWNVFKHFYPYFDEVKVDWDAEFLKAIKKSYVDKTEKDFKRTLQRMTATLNDGHIQVRMFNEWPLYRVPISMSYVEGKIIIERCADSSLDLHPGDIIEKINEVETKKILKKREQFYSASTKENKTYLTLFDLFENEFGTSYLLTLNSGKYRENKKISVNFPDSKYYSLWEISKPAYMKISKEIFYVNLTQISYNEFKKLLGNLILKKAIIFDLRGYPTSLNTLYHMFNKEINTANWIKIPQKININKEVLKYKEENWRLKPHKPYIPARKIFITDTRAYSAAESFLNFIKHYKIGIIIGEKTAGINGGINIFYLPGSYQIMFTGMKTTNFDGSQFHGIGVIPDIPLKRTIKGIREGRDEFLEKAIKIAMKNVEN